MMINPDKCVACGNCTYVCPMGAISIDPVLKRATIDRDECVECYTCFNGLSQEHLNPTLVRTVRKVFAAMRIRFEPEPDVCRERLLAEGIEFDPVKGTASRDNYVSWDVLVERDAEEG